MEIFIGGDFGKRDGVREPVHGECIADSKSAGDVAFVAAVVFGGGTNVPSINAVGCHVALLAGGDVDDNPSAGRCKWTLVEVKVAVEAGMGGEAGLAT